MSEDVSAGDGAERIGWTERQRTEECGVEMTDCREEEWEMRGEVARWPTERQRTEECGVEMTDRREEEWEMRGEVARRRTERQRTEECGVEMTDCREGEWEIDERQGGEEADGETEDRRVRS
ncbi:MAG: hypothetical protein HY814_02195 [Candidatus Riflebacteria bacterium]|nr:hypothetical protein [Candidatus Riflebacteria bacterium]